MIMSILNVFKWMTPNRQVRYMDLSCAVYTTTTQVFYDPGTDVFWTYGGINLCLETTS